jgi:maleylacetate reductase
MTPLSVIDEELDFTHRSAPGTVRFGRNTLGAISETLTNEGLVRGLVICSPEQKALGRRVEELLGDACVGVHAKAVVHVPVETAATAIADAKRVSAQSLVAVGGGSAIGLAKAVALEMALPIVAVPTTFAGSEMTPVWGMTENGNKQTGRSPQVRPVAVVYDPTLTDTLPTRMAVASGINALAHAAEALWAPDRSPVTSLLALEGARAITGALQKIAHGTAEPGDRDRALYGAWLCGGCLGATTMGIHHVLCHAVGGTLNLPHAETHTVILPAVLQLQRQREPRIINVICEALNVAPDDLAATIRGLAAAADLPITLAELGMHDGDLSRVTDNVHLSPAAHKIWTAADVTQTLTVALHGD